MNRSEFIMVTAIVLFAVFVIGWFTSLIIQRLTRPTNANMGELDLMAQQLHDSEQARDNAVAQLELRESELSRHLTSREAELQATMDALGEARAEVEDLREYIERLRIKR